MARFSISRSAIPLLVLGVLTVHAQADPASEYRPGEVIVHFVEGPSKPSAASFASAYAMTFVQESYKGHYELYRLPPSMNVEGAVATLRSDPRIDSVQPNYIYTVLDCPQESWLRDWTPGGSNQWGIFRTNLPALWRATGGGGTGEVIAILDTGVDRNHPDLDGALLPGATFIPGTMDETDDFSESHGTHVTGIAGARANDLGIVGVAYTARILPVKVLDSTGHGSSQSMKDGIDWAVVHGATVINMSFGRDDPYDPAVHNSIKDAYAMGVVLVAGAGNHGPEVYYPARYPEVISVGQVKASRAVSDSSNYGLSLDVVAPGYDVLSTIRGGGWGTMSGTSMATPFVSGVCALLHSKFPGMRPWEMREYLHRHAIDVDHRAQGTQGNRDGYGMICFGSLKDWSNAPLDEAWSNDSFFEWLGNDVTGESSLDDRGTVGADDHDDSQPDLDGIPNSSGDDGADDGVFHAGNSSYALMPFLPGHLLDAGSLRELDVELSVGNSMGERYNYTGNELIVRTWVDWNSDGQFDNTNERAVDMLSSPHSWPTLNQTTERCPMTPAAEHMRGNPLRFRTRLTYRPYDPDPGPTGAQAFGEVEDQSVLNFVEDFDLNTHVKMPGYFATIEPVAQGSWMVVADPPPMPNVLSHRGKWHFAQVQASCPMPHNDRLIFPDTASPAFDLQELTHCYLRLWMGHGVCLACPLKPVDNCRVSILRYSATGASLGETDLYKIPNNNEPTCQPPGMYYSETRQFDLSAYVGGFLRVVVHHDLNSRDILAVDDVQVWGYDGRDPKPTFANFPGGSREDANRNVSLSWKHPDDNNPSSASDSRAVTYAMRLDRSVSGSSFDRVHGYRLTPRDFVNAGSAYPVPGAPDADATAKFLAPTIFTDLVAAMRTEDEVASRNNVTEFAPVAVARQFRIAMLNGPPKPGLAAPGKGSRIAASAGDTLTVLFTLANQSEALDAIQLAVTEARNPPWVLSDLPTSVLAGGENDIVAVQVAIPPGAIDGDTDTISLQATSLSDPTQIASAVSVVTVGGTEAPSVDAVCLADRVLPLAETAHLDLSIDNPGNAPGIFDYRLRDEAGWM